MYCMFKNKHVWIKLGFSFCVYLKVAQKLYLRKSEDVFFKTVNGMKRHITSPWDSRRWSRCSRTQTGTLWHLEKLVSEGRGECEAWQQQNHVKKKKVQIGCGVLTLCTPNVPKGRGLLVFVSIRRTSASNIILWPPGKAWGMNSLKWATWNTNMDGLEQK